MANVSDADRNAMANLMQIMEGKKPTHIVNNVPKSGAQPVELLGPGVVSNAEIDAMAKVLEKLKMAPVTPSMITENVQDRELAEAMETKKIKEGVKVGKYQIKIKEDVKRMAGKQYYVIYHNATGDVIADDITLYETALTVVRLLNNGKFVNNTEIRKLFEYDTVYTSHKVDALLYKRRLNKGVDAIKQDIYESRYQASLDRAMTAKKQIKAIANNGR